MTDNDPDRRAFLAAIEAAPWDHELPRLVYADWLDERGEHDEADRQRKWVPAERWLRAFVDRLRSEILEGETDWYGNPIEPPVADYADLVAHAVRFHESHSATGLGVVFAYNPPDSLYEAAPEMWANLEVVTGYPPPEDVQGGVYRYPFRCKC